MCFADIVIFSIKEIPNNITKLANIAEKKNPDKDYTQMMELLRG